MTNRLPAAALLALAVALAACAPEQTGASAEPERAAESTAPAADETPKPDPSDGGLYDYDY